MTIDTITIILLITIGNLLTGSFVFADIFKKQNIENRMAFVIINPRLSAVRSLILLRDEGIPANTIYFDTSYRPVALGFYDAKKTDNGTWKRALFETK
jgi:hypothetical protein